MTGIRTRLSSYSQRNYSTSIVNNSVTLPGFGQVSRERRDLIAKIGIDFHHGAHALAGVENRRVVPAAECRAEVHGVHFRKELAAQVHGDVASQHDVLI